MNLSIYEGETLGLVGESGCGKTTVGKCILRLIEPTSGEVYFEGRDILTMDGRSLRAARAKMQMVFQNPFSSLDPRMKVAEITAEPLRVHGLPVEREKINDLLEVVGLSPEHANRYPHEFSGGQKQRIGIARAIALSPKLIVADEPVSALDVSVQATILNLLRDLQAKFGLSYLFIAHDIGVIKHMSDRIAVMYVGQIIELAEKAELLKNPLHPYTEALLSAVPIPHPKVRKDRITLKGELPSSVDPAPGCRFAPRCPHPGHLCRSESPDLVDAGGGHLTACSIRR